MPPRLENLAQPGVYALNGVGGVDHPTHLGREGKKGNHLVPDPAPRAHHGGEFLAPWAALKRIQFGQCRLGAGCGVDRLDGRCQRLAILPVGIVQAVAYQVHDAGLQRCFGVHHLQGLTHALEAIGDRNQHIVATPGLHVIEDFHPELCTLGVFYPDAQDVTGAVSQHAQSQIDGLVTHHTVFSDLHAQGIKEDHRVHRLQWAGLPGGDFAHDGICDAADELGRHVYGVHLGQKCLNLAHRHAASVHGDDLVVKTSEAALVFADELRLKAASTVTWHLNANSTTVSDDGLGTGAVAVVGDSFGFVLSGAVTQVVTHLRTHGAFDESLLEILKNVSELLFGHRTRDQLLEHLLTELRQGRFAARCGCLGLARHENSFVECYALHTKFLTGSSCHRLLKTPALKPNSSRPDPLRVALCQLGVQICHHGEVLMAVGSVPGYIAGTIYQKSVQPQLLVRQEVGAVILHLLQ